MLARIEKKSLIHFILWFFIINALYFWIIGFNYLSHIFNSSTLFKNSFADFSGSFERIFVVFYWLISYLCFMGFLAFLPGLPILIYAYRFTHKKLIYALSIFIASLSFIVILIDNKIFFMFNFHVNSTILTMLFHLNMNEVFSFSLSEILLLIAIFLSVICLEIITAWFVWHKIILRQRFLRVYHLGFYWLLGMFFCCFNLIGSISNGNNLFSQQFANLPFFNQVFSFFSPKNIKEDLKQYTEAHYMQRQFSNESLHYPLHQLQCKSPNPAYNIIFILVDSLRFDSVANDSMPYLFRFKLENWQFQNQYSGGNATQPGLFTLFYSIPSNYWSAAQQQKISPILITLLQKYGYDFGVFWSSPIDNPPFNQTIFATLPKNNSFFSSNATNVGDRDREITTKAIQFLLQHKKQQPFFLNVFYDAAHSYCKEQNFTTPNILAKSPCFRMVLNNDSDKTPYLNRYQNAVHFIDSELEKLLETIKQQGYLENSILIITSDHGEEFNDYHHNYWGHTSNIAKVQTHIPLIIHWPQKKQQIFHHITTGYDLVPTLLQDLFACQNNVKDYSIGHHLLSIKQNRYPILVGGYGNMGYIENDLLTTLFASGEVALTDLQLNPTQEKKPRIVPFKQALKWMRMYYSK